MGLYDYIDLNDYIVFNTKVKDLIEEANKNKNQLALSAGVGVYGSCHKDQAVDKRVLDLKFTKDGLKCEDPRATFDNQENLKTLTLKSPGIYLNKEGYDLLIESNQKKFKLGREWAVRHPIDGVKPKVYYLNNDGEPREYSNDNEIYKLDESNHKYYISIIIELIEKGQLEGIEFLIKDYSQPKYESVLTQEIKDLNEKKNKLEKLLASLNPQTMSAGSKKKKKFRSKRRKSLNKRKSRKSRKSRKRNLNKLN